MRRLNHKNVLVAVHVATTLMCGALLAINLRVMDNLAGATYYTLAVFIVMAIVGACCGSFIMRAVCRRAQGGRRALGVALFFICLLLLAQLFLAAPSAQEWQRSLSALTRSLPKYHKLLLMSGGLFGFAPALLVVAVAQGALALSGDLLPRKFRKLFFLLILHALGITGYFFANALLVPWGGLCGAMRMAVIWFAFLAGLTLFKRWACMAPFILVAIPLVILDGNKCEVSLIGGSFSRLVHRDSGFARGAPEVIRHTRRHTIARYQDPDYQTICTLDGRPILFGNRFHTARILSAYIPLLLQPECGRVILYGDESALYAPFFQRAGVESVMVVGSGATYSLLRQGDAVAQAQQSMPKIGWHTPRGGCDVFYIAPEPAWMRRGARKLRRGFLRGCARNLNEKGLLALHLDTRVVSQRMLASIVRDFARELPYLQLWCPGAHEWLLIGSRTAIETPSDKMLTFFERDEVAGDLARAGVLSLPEALAGMVCDGAGLVPWMAQCGFERRGAYARSVPALLFDAKPDQLVTPYTVEVYRQQTLEWLRPGELDPTLYQIIRAKAVAYGQARTLAARALWRMDAGRGDLGMGHAREAAKLNPRDSLLTQLADALELEGRRRITLGEFKGGLKCYENLLSFAPGTARSHFGMGYCLRATGDSENAYLHFARAVAAAPEQVAYRMELAQAAAAVGEFTVAEQQYEEILKREPENYEAIFRLSKVLAHKDRADKDVARAIKLAEQLCADTKWQKSEYAFGLADLYIDAGRVLEGMGLKRKLKAEYGEKP